MPYLRKTLRKMPPHTRKMARMLNELESVHRRLRNQMDSLQTLELYARASMRATEAQEKGANQ